MKSTPAPTSQPITTRLAVVSILNGREIRITIPEGIAWNEAYILRDDLQNEALRNGKTLTETRFAVRTL